MTLEQATQRLKELGNIYAVALAEKGHNIDDKSDLMNGLAAYYMLDLAGEFDDLDESVDAVVRIVYEEVRRKLSPIGIGDSSMTTAVYFNDPYGEVVLIATFLMKTDAEGYVKESFLGSLKIKELSHDAWHDFESIKEKV